MLALFLGADEMGHPIAMPPATPPERVAAVRAALATMVDDPAFKADAARRGLDLLPGRAEELEHAVAEAFQAPASAIEIARKYYRQ